MSVLLTRAALVAATGLTLGAAAAAASAALPCPTGAACATAATPVVAGVVRDERGAPLDGVQIDVRHGERGIAGTTTAADGQYRLRLPDSLAGVSVRVTARRVGFRAETRTLVARGAVRADFTLRATSVQLEQVTLTGQAAEAKGRAGAAVDAANVAATAPSVAPAPPALVTQPLAGRAPGIQLRGVSPGPASAPRIRRAVPPVDREQYDRIDDNPFLAVAGNPRSTFSVDVDRASYGNVRRFLVQGTRPPADAVRLEELVNYFPYALPAPAGDAPIAIHTEVAAAPWRPAHRLVRVALQARPIDVERLPANNLVFLLDVSGSMQSEDKLPLVKRSLRLLVDQLRPQDRVALVVYAGSAGVVLPPTPGTEKARIAEAIERLEAGGSTAGGEGLRLAYRVAREHYARGGNNRVILATDGDFNVGVSSDAELERMVEQERASGVALTVLGFGTGNYQDAKMKKLAKRGDGNFAYIDRLDEARKALVEELGATLVTVARDVKLQVEFNPAVVRGYRLLGYEGRLLRDEDFADDAKDAGDVGAGHTVTALYEVVLVGTASPVTLRGSEPLRYGAGDEQAARRAPADELLHVALRYKRPGEATSRLLTAVVPARAPRTAGSDDLRFAASVAAFGMLLRESPFKGEADVQQVLTLARASLGADPGGYRAEFVRLVERWREIEPVVAGR